MERDRRMALHERALAAVRSRLAEHERTLAELRMSRSWRLVQWLQNTRQRLVPRGSHRTQALRSALQASRELWTQLRRSGARVRTGVVAMLRSLRIRRAETLLPTEPVPAPAPLVTHSAPVDVVICVHNALADVRACLDSLIRGTLSPYRLILVDDGSGEETRDYLASFAAAQGASLIRNDAARGYTVAANQGLRLGAGKYAVLLNSDTVLSPRWLDRLIACAESDGRIGIVGPISNTASWQSVPEVLDRDGDWAANELPEDLPVAGMAELVARASPGVYPRIPFLNGFCLLIRREMLHQVGLLDEETFPQGYGEENDLCLRAARAGWTLAVAGDAYVYHAQSKSYSHERRLELARQADVALPAKHGKEAVIAGVQACRFDRVLAGIRARVRAAVEQERLLGGALMRWEGKRVLFVLPISEPGGGGHVVMQEAEAMVSMGVDARLINLREYRSQFESAFPNLEVPVIYVDGVAGIATASMPFDAVIATANHTVEWLEPIADESHPIRAYYVQDFEPAFYADGAPGQRVARQSYTRIPGLVRFTKTDWNRDEVREHIGVECAVVGPSVDIDMFRPRPRRGDGATRRPVRVAAMVRPSTPRRAPELTMRLLRRLKLAHGDEIEVVLFGCPPSDPAFRHLTTSFPWRHAGVLTRPRLASLLNDVDVFADFSTFQAMGLTAMEAMACGAAVIVPAGGGAASFASHERNALVVDTGDEAACLQALERLVTDHDLRTRLQLQAIEDICEHPPGRAARRILETLFPASEGG